MSFDRSKIKVAQGLRTSPKGFYLFIAMWRTFSRCFNQNLSGTFQAILFIVTQLNAGCQIMSLALMLFWAAGKKKFHKHEAGALMEHLSSLGTVPFFSLWPYTAFVPAFVQVFNREVCICVFEPDHEKEA